MRIGRISGSQLSWSGAGSCGTGSDRLLLTIAALASDIWIVELK
jgi:hypothetical protein